MEICDIRICEPCKLSILTRVVFIRCTVLNRGTSQLGTYSQNIQIVLTFFYKIDQCII